MELKELTVEKLTDQCRDLDRKYELLRAEYEQSKDLYSAMPSFENHEKLHDVHDRLIRCLEELSDSQNKLIEAYWSYFGVRHWQFKAIKDGSGIMRA
ncbi:MAG TPA: hypothetical protein PLO24_10550 [Bacteroidales bacterium]|jgi:hypothetical protein|nr:hypothetical protein [Bacteroidales bacterium]HOS72825.1 hypothetical protein [Bacteroidales bacterium]HQH23331.1 hypothetical protein [Bacteroidales bacterium]HQJ83086.1 hypothetical protein [Bacteroidales bacterium]